MQKKKVTAARHVPHRAQQTRHALWDVVVLMAAFWLAVLAMEVWTLVFLRGNTKSERTGVSTSIQAPVTVTVSPSTPPVKTWSADQVFLEETILPIIRWEAAYYPVPFGRARLQAVADGDTDGSIIILSDPDLCYLPSAIACVRPSVTKSGVTMVFNTTYFREQLAVLDWQSFMDEVVLTTVHEELHIELGHFEDVDAWANTRHENEVQWRTAQRLVEPSMAYGRFSQRSVTTAAMMRAYVASRGNDRSHFWRDYIDLSVAR